MIKVHNRTLGKLLKNKYAYYIVLFLSAISVVNYVLSGNVYCLLSFVGIVILTSKFLTKNKTLPFVFALFASSFLLGCGKIIEGMENPQPGGNQPLQPGGLGAEGGQGGNQPLQPGGQGGNQSLQPGGLGAEGGQGGNQPLQPGGQGGTNLNGINRNYIPTGQTKTLQQMYDEAPKGAVPGTYSSFEHFYEVWLRSEEEKQTHIVSNASKNGSGGGGGSTLTEFNVPSAGDFAPTELTASKFDVPEVGERVHVRAAAGDTGVTSLDAIGVASIDNMKTVKFAKSFDAELPENSFAGTAIPGHTNLSSVDAIGVASIDNRAAQHVASIDNRKTVAFAKSFDAELPENSFVDKSAASGAGLTLDVDDVAKKDEIFMTPDARALREKSLTSFDSDEAGQMHYDQKEDKLFKYNIESDKSKYLSDEEEKEIEANILLHKGEVSWDVKQALQDKKAADKEKKEEEEPAEEEAAAETAHPRAAVAASNVRLRGLQDRSNAAGQLDELPIAEAEEEAAAAGNFVVPTTFASKRRVAADAAGALPIVSGNFGGSGAWYHSTTNFSGQSSDGILFPEAVARERGFDFNNPLVAQTEGRATGPPSRTSFTSESTFKTSSQDGESNALTETAGLVGDVLSNIGKKVGSFFNPGTSVDNIKTVESAEEIGFFDVPIFKLFKSFVSTKIKDIPETNITAYSPTNEQPGGDLADYGITVASNAQRAKAASGGLGYSTINLARTNLKALSDLDIARFDIDDSVYQVDEYSR